MGVDFASVKPTRSRHKISWFSRDLLLFWGIVNGAKNYFLYRCLELYSDILYTTKWVSGTHPFKTTLLGLLPPRAQNKNGLFALIFL